jgi:hypothetical protein
MPIGTLGPDGSPNARSTFRRGCGKGLKTAGEKKKKAMSDTRTLLTWDTGQRRRIL